MFKKDENGKTKPTKLYIYPTILLAVGIIFILTYFILSNGYSINYQEDSQVDYSVCLKENKFYESKCVSQGNQYVASLIDYIPAKFNYKLNLYNSNIEYVYNYKIVADFNVKDSETDKILFTKDEVLYQSENRTTNNGISINYDMNIDYNKYNNLLNSFISVYDLNQTKNELKVSMYVTVKNALNSKVDLSGLNSSKATSITIPLTTKTVNIDISGTSLNTNTSKLTIKPEKSYTLLLFISAILIVCAIALYLIVLSYVKKSTTVRDIYEKRIKKISLMYDSYIQKINGNYPIGASQICKVSNFQDMIEIKESSEKPLLMLENKEKTGTFFLIPVGEGVIYTYAIRIIDIESELKGETPPDYNKKDIISENSKEKLYTIEKIKEDIKNTTEIAIVDDKNAILGTNNSDEDLYEQIGKTSNYNYKRKK